MNLIRIIILFFVTYPILDIVLIIFVVGSTANAWRQATGIVEGEPQVEERSLGSMIILSQLRGVITGSSIVIVGLTGAATLLPKEELIQSPVSGSVFIGAIFAITSLACALYTMATMSSKTRTQNPVMISSIAIMSSLSLVLCFVAASRLVIVIALVLFEGLH